MKRGSKIKQFCKNGHDSSTPDKRYKDGGCKQCNKDQSKSWSFANPEKKKQSNLQWRRNNPEKIKKFNQEWRQDNPEKSKESERNSKWKYLGVKNPDGSKFTNIDYEKAFLGQEGKCKICEKHQSKFKRALAADHNHITGIFRSLLCGPCNLRLGFREDRIWKEKDDEYLGNFKNIR